VQRLPVAAPPIVRAQKEIAQSLLQHRKRTQQFMVVLRRNIVHQIGNGVTFGHDLVFGQGQRAGGKHIFRPPLYLCRVFLIAERHAFHIHRHKHRRSIAGLLAEKVFERVLVLDKQFADIILINYRAAVCLGQVFVRKNHVAVYVGFLRALAPHQRAGREHNPCLAKPFVE